MKCRIEASFLVPVSFKISSALIPCSLIVSYCTVTLLKYTHSSTECERTGELRPSIAGVAKDLIGVEASERREVDAPFWSSGRRFLIILVLFLLLPL